MFGVSTERSWPPDSNEIGAYGKPDPEIQIVWIRHFLHVTPQMKGDGKSIQEVAKYVNFRIPKNNSNHQNSMNLISVMGCRIKQKGRDADLSTGNIKGYKLHSRFPVSPVVLVPSSWLGNGTFSHYPTMAYRVTACSKCAALIYYVVVEGCALPCGITKCFALLNTRSRRDIPQIPAILVSPHGTIIIIFPISVTFYCMSHHERCNQKQSKEPQVHSCSYSFS